MIKKIFLSVLIKIVQIIIIVYLGTIGCLVLNFFNIDFFIRLFFVGIILLYVVLVGGEIGNNFVEIVKEVQLK